MVLAVAVFQSMVHTIRMHALAVLSNWKKAKHWLHSIDSGTSLVSGLLKKCGFWFYRANSHYIYFSILFDVSCKNCNSILNGEYMGKDGVPYCEKCYQKLFGVKCAYCNRYISGKVLQAGDNHHFHPTCARCTKCGIRTNIQSFIFEYENKYCWLFQVTHLATAKKCICKEVLVSLLRQTSKSFQTGLINQEY